MIKVKICGITNNEDAELVASLQVDYIGFIFAHSPRQVNKDIVNSFIFNIPETIKKVGLFVNEDIHIVKKIFFDLKLDFVQLHGDEDSEYIKKLELPVIKVFRIKNNNSIINLEKYLNSIKNQDFPILIDAYHKDKYGGTGRVMDIPLAQKAIALYDKIMLAGGLDDQNITTILKKTNPFAADASSGLEQSPGKKDPDKVKNFIKAIKSFKP